MEIWWQNCKLKRIIVLILTYKCTMFFYLQDESKLYIFLELVTKGSLASVYRKYRLRDSHVSDYTRQILSGLHYLHSREVMHRWYICSLYLAELWLLFVFSCNQWEQYLDLLTSSACGTYLSITRRPFSCHRAMF